jgi:hypothetical protein
VGSYDHKYEKYADVSEFKYVGELRASFLYYKEKPTYVQSEGEIVVYMMEDEYGCEVFV